MTSSTPEAKRYECRWHEASELAGSVPAHYWVDHSPEEPHWPGSGVMRWDLRQDDWHKIWPELVDHPCAILFAPKHPSREGAPRFRDWVESWPKTFDWKSQLPDHLQPAIVKALNELSSPVTNTPSEQKQPEPPATAEPPARTIDPDEMLEHLSAILLDIDDNKRRIIAQHLATLAMAPDSSRVIQALKLAFAR